MKLLALSRVLRNLNEVSNSDMEVSGAYNGEVRSANAMVWSTE